MSACVLRIGNGSQLALESCFSKTLYKGRNAIERMFSRLKDCRRLATRYDKLAANFLGNIHLAAAIMWWL